MPERVATVAIGRNEGERLARCLASVNAEMPGLIVYVDSGSTDNSMDIARRAGASVVELDMSVPFNAARARNAGLERAVETDPGIELVQFIDGDCELLPGWFDAASAALRAEPDLAAVYGRQRERFPQATLWNGLMDREWDTPVGEATECGGNALYRRAALDDVGGFRADLIAGEEPEMCFRMRRKNWRLRSIGADMALHDAAMTRFGQWWRRSQRGGFAYASLSALHGRTPERFKRAENRRALLWGLAVPAAALIGLFVSPWSLLLLGLWPLQVLRLRWRGETWTSAFFLTLGKVAEMLGILEFWLRRLFQRTRGAIEYK